MLAHPKSRTTLGTRTVASNRTRSAARATASRSRQVRSSEVGSAASTSARACLHHVADLSSCMAKRVSRMWSRAPTGSLRPSDSTTEEDFAQKLLALGVKMPLKSMRPSHLLHDSRSSCSPTAHLRLLSPLRTKLRSTRWTTRVFALRSRPNSLALRWRSVLHPFRSKDSHSTVISFRLRFGPPPKVASERRSQRSLCRAQRRRAIHPPSLRNSRKWPTTNSHMLRWPGNALPGPGAASMLMSVTLLQEHSRSVKSTQLWSARATPQGGAGWVGSPVMT